LALSRLGFGRSVLIFRNRFLVGSVFFLVSRSALNFLLLVGSVRAFHFWTFRASFCLFRAFPFRFLVVRFLGFFSALFFFFLGAFLVLVFWVLLRP